MANFAVLDANGRVTNIIVTENKEQSEQDLGCVLIESTSDNVAAIGLFWDGASFIQPPQTPQPEIVEEPVVEEPVSE